MKLTNNILSVALLAIAAGSFARQTEYSGKVTAEGGGQLVRNGERLSLKGMELSFGTGRNVSVTLIGNRRWTYKGDYRPTGQDNLEISIFEAYGDRRARGTVQVDVVNGRVIGLKVNGDAAGSGFSADFRTDSGGYLNNSNKTNGFSLQGTYRGAGNYVVNRSQNSIGQVDVQLRQDGTFVIKVAGQGDITGTYRLNNDRSADLTVDRFFGTRNSDATGTITLDNSRSTVSNISIRTRSDRNQQNLDFRPGDQGRMTSIRQSRSGTGNLRIDRSSQNVNNATINLNANGTFDIRIAGQRDQTFSGTWRESNNRAILTIERSSLGRNVTGNGTANISRSYTEVTDFNISGNADRAGFSSSFRFTTVDNPIRPQPDPRVDTGMEWVQDAFGTGMYMIGNDTSEVTEVRFNPLRNGEFSMNIHLRSTTQTLGGTYRIAGNRLLLNIDRGMGRGTQGTGTVVMTVGNNGVDQIDLKGDWNGHQFSFSFRSKSR